MSLPQAKLSDVIDVRHPGPAPPGAPSSTLAKTPMLEVRRLVLARAGRSPPTMPPGRSRSTAWGRIASTADGTTRKLGAGQMLVLAAGEPHSLVGLEGSSVLVTRVLPANPPAL